MINFFSNRFIKLYKIINLKSGKKYIAKVHKLNFVKYQSQIISSLISEVDISTRLCHHSILQNIGFSLTNFKNKPKPVIISEYSSYFALNQLQDFNDTEKLIILYGIASGMSYLHFHNIIHRDLKMLNIFYDDSKFPKISGFDYATELQTSDEIIEETTIKGTIDYCSPEILSGLKYSKSSDVYAFSLILYEMLTNNKPFDLSESELIKNVVELGKRPELKSDIPLCYRQLIQKCWSQDPRQRPTFNEIVEELKNNPDFITEKINKEDYFNAIKIIEESPKKFDAVSKKQEIYEFIQSKS